MTTTSPESSRSTVPAKAFASGPIPYRVLMLGAESIAGMDRAAAAQTLAEGLATRTGHGVDVEALEPAPLAASESGDLLAGQDLSRIDATVVVLDARDATASGDAVRRLTDGLADRVPIGSAVVVVVPPSGIDGRAARDAVGALVRVVELDEMPDSTADQRLARWSAAIVDATSSALIDPMVRFQPDDPFDEFARVDAVGRIGHRYTEWADTFQDVVEGARATYSTPSAAMSIIDDETTRYFARSGDVAVSLPRGKSVCNRVMRIYGGLILGDARLDHRFSGLPEVKTGDVRFYAGYRITGPDGAPFGALCVFDSEPRDVSDDDLTELRDLALDAQRRLWALLGTPPA
ncbi:MAG: GAF domain-containing protein [Acidobacteria bacterium]|nr:GAF domain-containing protein [Acidobacteriota bacterium]